MSKNKQNSDEGVLPEGDADLEQVVQESISKPAPVDPVAVHYKPASWKDVKTVFRCEACGLCRDEEDDIILHVIDHVDQKERDQLFNQLIEMKGT